MNKPIKMWECLANHEHKKKRVAERCSHRAEMRAAKAKAIVTQMGAETALLGN